MNLEIVKKECEPVIDQLGYDLVRVTYEKEFGNWELTLFIRNKNGEPITHEDCKTVTYAVDDLLENLDPTKGEPYNFSVASEGVDCDCPECKCKNKGENKNGK